MIVQHEDVERMLRWRAQTVRTRLCQALLVSGLVALATHDILAAPWFAAVAATIALDAWLSHRALRRGVTADLPLALRLALVASSVSYASIGLLLIRDCGHVGLAEAGILNAAVLLNAVMMSRGAWTATVILGIPPSLLLLSLPGLAWLWGAPLRLQDAVTMTVGASSYVVFVALLVRMFSAESRTLRAAVAAMEAREASFRLLFDENPMPMLVIDGDSHAIIAANGAIETTFGLSRDALRDIPATDFLPVDDRAYAVSRLGEAGTRVDAVSYEVRDGEGCPREILPYIRPTVFEGRPAVLAAVLDITERRQAMAAMEAARDAAEAANRAKSDFLATMSHEIRTPLNGVLGMAQVMARDDLPAAQRERLAVIVQSGETLLALLNDILDVSKIEAGRLDLEDAAFDLGELTRGAHAAFATAASAKGVVLTVEIEPAAAGVYRGDSVRVRQILFNLMSNAVKFTDAGAVVVRLDAGADGVRWTVRDTGVGVAADRLGALFDKFVQADSSTTRRFGGTGLGLAISAELATAMGGAITVQSVLGVGSTFTVTLPLERVDEADVTAAAAPAIAPVAERPLRVLAAEDNPVNQLVLKTLLAQLGLETRVVDDGAAAVEAWAQQDWDLILMDVQMPVMDGPSAARAIRAVEAASGRARTPIIALTANAMTHQLDGYREAGMDAVVAKPIHVAALLAAIGEAIDGAIDGAGASAPPTFRDVREA